MKKKYLMFFILSLCFAVNSYSQIIANGTYKIFSSVHNEVMTCATSAPHDANMTAPNPSNNYQLWTFTHQGGDIYKILNSGSGKYLGINDGWCGNFGDAKANFNATEANILLKVASTPIAGKYTFEIAFTTCNFGSINTPIKAFDVQDGNSGAQIQTYEINNTNSNQQFSIVTPESLSASAFSDAPNFNLFFDTTKSLNIKTVTDLVTKLEVSVFEINGKLVHKSSYNSVASNEIRIDLSSLSKGVYMIQLLGNDSIKSVEKIIVY
jgi:Secretion system C-terminal sorting domain